MFSEMHVIEMRNCVNLIGPFFVLRNRLTILYLGVNPYPTRWHQGDGQIKTRRFGKDDDDSRFQE